MHASMHALSVPLLIINTSEGGRGGAGWGHGATSVYSERGVGGVAKNIYIHLFTRSAVMPCFLFYGNQANSLHSNEMSNWNKHDMFSQCYVIVWEYDRTQIWFASQAYVVDN